MLKKGQEVLSFIKTDSKISNKEVLDLEYRINDVVYKRNHSYIAPATASTLYSVFVEYGKQISSINVTDKQKQHKEQVLAQLRTICQNVRTYSKSQLTVSDLEQIKGTMKYRIYKFLEAKRNNTLTDSVILDHLRINTEIWLDMVSPLKSHFSEKELKDFKDLNGQLLNIINNRYQYEQA